MIQPIAQPDPTVPPADLKQQVIAAFDRYMEVWEFDDYWTRANTFEAAIEFVTAARRLWPNNPDILKSVRKIDEVIFGNITYFQSKLSNIDAIWADDFGWCGNASLSARRYILDFPDTEQIVKGAGTYLEIADQCWRNLVDIGWDATDTARPVPHGCYNAPKVAQPSHTPFKNTVTNATFFLLCSRLYVTTRDLDGFDFKAYLAKSNAQYTWFDAWFNSDYGYLRPPGHPVQMNARLIGERPIAAPDYERKQMWQPGLVWSGDHGLMLAALTIYAAINPEAAPAALKVIRLLAVGLSRMFFDTSGVLQEAPFKSLFSGDPKDYVCGRGVLLRHLSSAPVLRVLGHDFRNNILATMSAVWNSRGDDDQFSASWNPDQAEHYANAFKLSWGQGDGSVTWQLGSADQDIVNGILQAAGLDALTAAMRVWVAGSVELAGKA